MIRLRAENPDDKGKPPRFVGQRFLIVWIRAAAEAHMWLHTW